MSSAGSRSKPSMRIHVLRNPSGGSKPTRRAAAQAIGTLRGGGHEVIELTGTSSEESSDALHAAISSAEVDRVLVAGGDGLVNLAIQHLAQTAIPLTISPTGSGNDFATALGIEPGGSVEAAVNADAQPVDLLRVSSSGDVHWVASIAISGFPASINARANSMSLPIGGQIYTVAAAMELPRFRRLELELLVDGEPVVLDSAMLAIGNTRFFGGGMLACPDARANDGLIHLTSIEGVGRAGVLRHLAGRTGGTAEREEVTRLTAKRVELATPGVEIWGDGEAIATSPLAIDIIPGALLVSGLTGH